VGMRGSRPASDPVLGSLYDPRAGFDEENRSAGLAVPLPDVPRELVSGSGVRPGPS
jgi:hypothetical protein